MTSTDFDYFPRLTRFYGLRPGVIARMPRCLIQIYLDQMQALQAEEQIAAYQAADMPHLEQGDRKRLYRQLQRIADLEEPEAPVINPFAEGGVNTLAGLGVKVVIEDSAKPAEEVTANA